MILNESQEVRDKELSEITGVPIEEIMTKRLTSVPSIKIFVGKETPKEDDFSYLYENFKWLDVLSYYRTMMYTGIAKRGPNLIKLLRGTKNSICLDFGCGVGSHSIALMENGNQVDMLDVNGPTLDLAKKRVKRRGLDHLCRIILNTDVLPLNYYDLAICTNVLEHVYDPIHELIRITKSLKQGGSLHLVVSLTVRHSSGHFPKSIALWKQKGPEILSKYYTSFGHSLYKKK